MNARHLVLGLVAIASIAGCDSTAQLTTTRTPTQTPIVATQSTRTVGTNVVISYVFNPADLPTAFTSDMANNPPRLVLSGKVVPLTSGPNNTLIATVPAQTPPPATDINGNVILVLQNNTTSQLLTVKVQQAPAS